MIRVLLRISAGILVGALFLVAVAIRLSDHYINEEQRLVAAGDHKGAMQSIRMAARLDPFGPEPLELQAFLLQSQDNDQAAAASLREAVARDPNNFVPYLLLANLQATALNDLDAGIKSYRKVLELNPHATVASNALAQTLVRANRLEEAAKVYQKMKDDNQITIEGLYDLGRIYVRTGKPEKGLKYIRQARLRVKKLTKETKGSQRQQLKSLSNSMELAIADALVVERRYDQARRVLQYSNADQAPAILQLLNTDPEGYRRQVENSAIY